MHKRTRLALAEANGASRRGEWRGTAGLRIGGAQLGSHRAPGATALRLSTGTGGLRWEERRRGESPAVVGSGRLHLGGCAARRC